MYSSLSHSSILYASGLACIWVRAFLDTARFCMPRVGSDMRNSGGGKLRNAGTRKEHIAGETETIVGLVFLERAANSCVYGVYEP